MRALVLLVLLAPASVAGAQEVNTVANAVVLSVGGDAPTEMAREARGAVAEALAADGLRVLSEDDLALRISPARLRECTGTACAHALGRELGVSLVAAVATWTQDGAPSSVTVSLVVGADRSYTATEEVGEADLEAAARRAVAGAQAARRRALIMEGPAIAAPSEVEEPEPEPESSPSRSSEEWVLPTLLGIMGLGLAGVAVYALMDGTCDRHGPVTGVCLAGDRPNYGLGGVSAVVAGLSIIGAIIWFVVGGETPEFGDLYVGPDGVRGTF